MKAATLEVCLSVHIKSWEVHGIVEQQADTKFVGDLAAQRDTFVSDLYVPSTKSLSLPLGWKSPFMNFESFVYLVIIVNMLGVCLVCP